MGVWSPALVLLSHYFFYFFPDATLQIKLLYCCHFLVPLDDWGGKYLKFCGTATRLPRWPLDWWLRHRELVFARASSMSISFSHGHCEEWFAQRDPTSRAKRSFMSKICFLTCRNTPPMPLAAAVLSLRLTKLSLKSNDAHKSCI